MKEASFTTSTLPPTYNLSCNQALCPIVTSCCKLALPSTRRSAFIITLPVNDVVSEPLPSTALAGIDSAVKLINFTSKVPALPEISFAFKKMRPFVASPPIITWLLSVAFALYPTAVEKSIVPTALVSISAP